VGRDLASDLQGYGQDQKGENIIKLSIEHKLMMPTRTDREWSVRLNWRQ